MAMNKLNDKMRAKREAAGMSMEDLARKSDVSISTIFRMENRTHVTLYENAKKVAKVLKIPLEDLM
jgi:transcriptional regulator with XRE-family HTH domain